MMCSFFIVEGNSLFETPTFPQTQDLTSSSTDRKIYSVVVISNHKVSPHPALFKGLKHLSQLKSTGCFHVSAKLRCVEWLDVKAWGSEGSMRGSLAPRYGLTERVHCSLT